MRFYTVGVVQGWIEVRVTNFGVLPGIWTLFAPGLPLVRCSREEAGQSVQELQRQSQHVHTMAIIGTVAEDTS